jgi:carbon storage regulator CsrA
MLVLSRKLQEQIKIGEEITVTVLKVKGNVVRVGIEAPKSMRVIRAELPKLNPTSHASLAVPEPSEGTAEIAEIEVSGDPTTSVFTEEPMQRPAGQEVTPSGLLLSLRRLRKRRTTAPLKSIIATCAALAK